MLSLVCCMRLFPTLLVPVSIPNSNLDHMPMALWVVQEPAYSVVKQTSNLSINQSALGQATASSQPTQTVSVLSVQSLDPKGNQQPGWNRKKGKNNRKGGNRNENANNGKNARDAGGDKQAKHKVKFPCKLCKEYHLTCALVSMKPRDSWHRAQLC